MVDIVSLRKTLLFGLFLLALGALTIHLKYHPPLIPSEGGGLADFTNTAAAVFSLIDVLLVTYLFSRKQTAVYAYLVNGLLVIYGTVIMGHCGIAKVFGPETDAVQYVFLPTLPYIIIAWADFFLGAALYRMWSLESARETGQAPRPTG